MLGHRFAKLDQIPTPLIRPYLLQITIAKSVETVCAVTWLLTVYNTRLLHVPCHLQNTELHHLLWNTPALIKDYIRLDLNFLLGIRKRLLNNVAQKQKLFLEGAPQLPSMITLLIAISHSLHLSSSYFQLYFQNF